MQSNSKEYKETSRNSHSIFIVNDSIEKLRFLSTLLVKEGYEVHQAINSKMALTGIQTQSPDVILLDILMPGMDGYEICKTLKNNPLTEKIPIIFLGTFNEIFDKSKIFEVGGVDYITEPLCAEEILIKIGHQLQLRNANQQLLRLNHEIKNKITLQTQKLENVNVQLIQMALHDTLTGLPSRVLFLEHLQESLNRAKIDSAYRFAVLSLDCDRFKIVNNSLGHNVGDELLIGIANRLQSSLNSTCILARLNADEFAVLLTEVLSPVQGTQLAENILESIADPFYLQGYEIFINMSIGIAFGNRHYHQPEHILRDADTALSLAKTQGKGCYQVFDLSLNHIAFTSLKLETELRQAISNQEFTVYYQPIVELKTGKISGFEALVRWHHPVQGLVPPAEFIPVAEETGLILDIDKWVLREACRQLYLWQQQQRVDETFTISVNLSAKQFSQPDLIQQIDQILDETQLNPQCLKLEITESVIMENIESATVILRKLRERKIQLSIDDFGTGYSSLSYLHCFPIDTLKVDKSFVQRLDGNPESLGLIPAIICIAQTMGMSVIAEGIETLSQLTQLRYLNCNYSQGYLFSKPLDAQNSIKLLGSSPQW
jgi:diguanylate cyclase (GGDEF)-like protein